MVQRSRSIYPGTTGTTRSLTLALLGWLAVVGCERAPEIEETFVRPVRYARVVSEGSSQSRIYSGTAQAALETDLSFRVPGTLVRRPVSVGETLVRGDVVGELDGTDYQVKVDEALAGLARAEAQLRNAQASYERTRNLYENQTASRSDLDAARAAAESSEAQLRAARQQLEAARLQLSYTRLTSPEECTVAQTYVEVNQNVASGQPIARVNCGECAEVLVSVPETDIARIAVGAIVRITFGALGREGIPGIVQEVGVASGPTSATFPVTVALQERCDDVRSGMAADVSFSLAPTGSGESVVVPYVAVGEDADGRFVYVLEPMGDDRMIARRREVRIGEARPTGLTIVDGLSAGELIATAGVHRLVSGQEVTLLGDR